MLEALEKNIDDAELVVNDIRKSQCLMNDDTIRNAQNEAQEDALLFRAKKCEIKGDPVKVQRTLFGPYVDKTRKSKTPEVPTVRSFDIEDSSREFKVAAV
jgi:hypothetical protein